MDHGGQFEREGSAMSHVQVGGLDQYDNVPNPDALTAQSGNLNDSNTLTQSQSLSPSQHEDGGGGGRTQEVGIVERRKEGHTGRDDEDEDIDEGMKEEEEEDDEEESEESSSFIRCQSPDTPMTDSSFSETGSLLETPYPISPGTSPEPTSPAVPVVSPETAYPTSQVKLSQTDTEVGSHDPSTESVPSNSGPSKLAPAFHTGPIDSSTLTVTSETMSTSPPGPTCISEATDRKTKSTDLTTELTSSTEPVYSRGDTCTAGFASSHAGPNTSTPETFTVNACKTRLNVSIASTPMSATSEPLTFTTGPNDSSPESTSTTGPLTSNGGHIASTPVPTGPIPRPALLESLQQLAHSGDETHLPQYLHQIAEAFVLHEDYQRALWCIQLERLYHQRVLDNLNALQEQWESQCERTSSDPETQHLDTLTHICQTHNRPRARDAVCPSVDFVNPTFKGGGALPPCTSVHHQVAVGMELKPEDSSHRSQSCPSVTPSINLPDGLNSPEIAQKDREDPGRELEGGAYVLGSQLTEKQGSSDGGGGESAVGYTMSAIGNELHPSTAGEMDRSEPAAEQQGGHLGPAPEKDAEREKEVKEEEEAAEALEMEEDGEGEEGEKQKEKEDSPSSPKALPVETVVSGAEVEAQQLHREALAEEKPHEDTQVSLQESATLCQQQGAHLSQEAHMSEEWKEEDEFEYEIEQADLIRAAASLDYMAQLITVEELSPASGLVSILKKRRVCVGKISVSAASSEQRPEQPLAKRRVHFNVPDDGCDVGSGDSCLLLFLLCMVTVVISLGGTALYCALGDAHSSVCEDFSRNADFYTDQIQRGIAHIQHWFNPGS